MDFDLIFRGGSIIDGTGRPAFAADVGIRGPRIAAVGDLSQSKAPTAIDATGQVVAPGFIDVHTHADGWLLKTPNLLAKTSQGFTTEVLMSDGISYAPVSQHNWREWFHYLRSLNGLVPEDYEDWRSIADYLALLDGHTAQNVIAEIPYANVRVLAAGWRRGPLDDAQINIMRREVVKAMEAGAVGISTGLDYVAENFSTTDELVEVCAAMAPWQGLYVTHVRYKKGTLGGVQEAVEIGRRAGVPVHISHLKAGTERDAELILDYVDRVAVNEVDFSFDIYPYSAGSTMFNYLLPYEVWEDGPLAVRDQLNDPLLRERFATLLECFPLPPEKIYFAWSPGEANTRYQGLSLAEIAASRDRSAADTVCELLLEEDLAVLSILDGGPDALVDPFLQHERFMLGTDGIHFPDGRVHPRNYGSTGRMLGPLVRERKLFSLEAAVQKMTGIPARRFGLVDRGEIREGAFADLVVFDPNSVTDRATFENPHQPCEGIEHVIVNGVEIVRRGVPIDPADGQQPGKALRFKNVSSNCLNQ